MLRWLTNTVPSSLLVCIVAGLAGVGASMLPSLARRVLPPEAAQPSATSSSGSCSA